MRSSSWVQRSGPTAQCRAPRNSSRRYVISVKCSQDLVPKGGDGSRKVRLSFKLPYRTAFGQDIAMVGSIDELGNWDPSLGMGMQWTEGDVWHVDFELPAGSNVEMEYKYVVRDPSGEAATWKPGSNYSFSLASLAPVLASGGGAGGGAARGAAPARVGGVAVRDAWDGAVRDVSVELAEGPRGPRPVTDEMRAHSASLALALDELASQIMHAEGASGEDGFYDPTSPEMLQADRMLAAAARKATAAARALQDAQVAAGHLAAASSYI